MMVDPSFDYQTREESVVVKRKYFHYASRDETTGVV